MAVNTNNQGIICDRCNRVVGSFNHYKINDFTTYRGSNFNSCSSDIRIKTINKINLCPNCYSEYKKIMINFLDLKGGEID